MSEDDFIIPRNSSSATAVGGTNQPNEAAGRVHVDQSVLEERQRRKEAIAPHPKAINANRDEPWRYLDQTIGGAFPAFDERMWTLGEAARWIAERTREAVDGLSIDGERLLSIVREIQEALAAHEVQAFAHTPNDPVPRELPSETWALCQLAVEMRSGLLHITPIRLSASQHDDPVLRDIRISRSDALRRWPEHDGESSSQPVESIGAVGGR